MNAVDLLKLAGVTGLLIGACLGHLGICIASHNWWYGCPLPRWMGKIVHLFHGFLFVAGIVLFGWLGPESLRNLAAHSVNAVDLFLAGYFLVCCVVGLVLVPVITWQRWRRRFPALLLSNHTQTVDVAKELGYPPAGTGRKRFLACLPGNEVFRVDFSERTLRLPRLPREWDGLTILHVSDLHFCGTPERAFYHFVLERCAGWEPDLVALTGDFVDSIGHRRWIMPLLSRLRWREAAFAILGNHDYWYGPHLVRHRLSRLKVGLLENCWKQIEVRGQPLVVVGHEGPWFKPAPDLSSTPRGPFRLCLSHTPDNLAWARRNHIDLMLSGHVHGGQIRLPLFGSLLVPSRLGRRYDCGTFWEPPTLLHVSRGLAGDHPLRYNCRPEVTLLVLRQAASAPDANDREREHADCS
jgi:predicted MPP superfamily phosphohydrolase